MHVCEFLNSKFIFDSIFLVVFTHYFKHFLFSSHIAIPSYIVVIAASGFTRKLLGSELPDKCHELMETLPVLTISIPAFDSIRCLLT